MKLVILILAIFNLLFRSKYVIHTRIILAVDLIRYCTKLVLIKAKVMAQPESESLLSFRVCLINYSEFVSLYLEIFCNSIYYFESSNNTPSIIDAGANIGIATLFYKVLYPTSKITAIEPDPLTFSILEKNIKCNGLKRVNIVQKALYKDNGTISFFSAPTTVNINEPTSVASSVNKDEFRSNSSQVYIETIKLSTLLDGKIDMLKLDVEGVEEIVLKESEHKLNNVENIIMEYHNYPWINNNKLSSIIALFEKNYKYVVKPLDEKNNLVLHYLILCKRN
jgi:FkbM family methyltransferase